jgi:heme/copper-type cytochrome/quinol oxidase subunit 4
VSLSSEEGQDQSPQSRSLTGKRLKPKKPASVFGLVIALVLILVWSLASLPSTVRSAVATMGPDRSLSGTLSFMLGNGLVQAAVVWAGLYFLYWRHRDGARTPLYFALILAVSLLVNVGGVLWAAST